MTSRSSASRLSICPETGTRRGPQAPKTTQNFYKKARSAFLFNKFNKFMALKPLIFKA